MVPNEVARKVDTLICIIVSEIFVFAYCEGGIFLVPYRALVRVFPKKIALMPEVVSSVIARSE